MSAFSKYAARSERIAARLGTTSCSALIAVATPHRSDVDNDLGGDFPVSGDMLAVVTRGMDSQADHRRRLMVRVLS